MNRIKLTSKGQITLPKEVRKRLSIETGNYLIVKVEDGKIILEPQRQEDDISLICEYAATYGTGKNNLDKVRKITSKLDINMQEYVRKVRDDKDNGT